MVGALRVDKAIDNGRKTPVILDKTITVDTYSKLDYIQKFEELKKQNVIVECNFYDDVWNIRNKMGDVIYHPLIGHGTSNNLIKFFLVLLLGNEDVATAYSSIAIVKKIQNITDDFLGDMKFQNEQVFVSKYDISVVKAYFAFIKMPGKVSRPYIEFLEKNCDDSDNCRKLSTMDSIIKLNTLIEDYTEYCVKYNLHFLMIVLWWKLTMAIPMRPIEFFTLKRDSISAIDGKYYIEISRADKSDPNDKNKHFIPLVTKFEITPELYELFSNYKKKHKPGEDGYLFNVNTLAKRKVDNERDFVGSSIYNNRLHRFFKEVVSGKYGYTVIEKETKQSLEKNEIEFINYGDTRHFAFLNLILSGYNPYDIAQLGGHRSLSEQLSYYGGAKPYCSSYAYALATGVTTKLPQNIKFGIERMIEYRKNLLFDEKKAIKLDNGYCLSPNFPYDCGGCDCNLGKCDYFRHDSIEKINNDIECIEKRIDRNMDFLKSILYTEPFDSISRQETVSDIKRDIMQLSRLMQERASK